MLESETSNLNLQQVARVASRIEILPVQHDQEISLVEFGPQDLYIVQTYWDADEFMNARWSCKEYFEIDKSNFYLVMKRIGNTEQMLEQSSLYLRIIIRNVNLLPINQL